MKPDTPSPDTEGIFNQQQAGEIKGIANTFSFVVPADIIHDGDTPYAGPTLADCEKFNNAKIQNTDTDIMKGKNIGNLADWYTDARFAQQHLSGVNPCTIETASPDKVKAYVAEADKQGLGDMKTLLSGGQDLLMQDYSYFREATGLGNDEVFTNKIFELTQGSGPTPTITATGNSSMRYACAPIVIFQLHSDGRLHPLAITLDYKGSLDNSVTIFNQRLTPDDTKVDEKNDWPWRYAKTCAQTADWARHEIAVHLVDTHLIEEAIIVGSHRMIPEEHLLYEILSPHWLKTLPLNFAARQLLVPGVIARISGLGPSSVDVAGSRVMSLLRWSYKNFNFQDKYVPNDLKKRGFDLERETGNKYCNYPYATDIYYLWEVIRDFVKSVLATKYKSDQDVQDDVVIKNWCNELITEGQINNFPTITSVDQLIDAVTMCIHIASPQHTAVNYLQDYYYSFVAAKPPALCTALPNDLKTLQAYTETEFTAALPIGTDGGKWKDWLLAAQLPELLSYQVAEQNNLITYAQSLYNVNKDRLEEEEHKFCSHDIAEAARLFYSRLNDLKLAFEYVSAIQTEGSIEYKVLQPDLTAISILI